MKSPLLTATAAASRLGIDRRTVCTHAAALGLGIRAGTSSTAPLLLSEREILAVKKRFQKISCGHKFKSGNTFHSLRKNPGRKKREQS